MCWGSKWLFSFCIFVLSIFDIMSNMYLCTFFKGRGGESCTCGCWWAKNGSTTGQVLAQLFLVVPCGKERLTPLSWKVTERHSLIAHQRQSRERVWPHSRSSEDIFSVSEPPGLSSRKGKSPPRHGLCNHLPHCPQGEPSRFSSCCQVVGGVIWELQVGKRE